MFWSAECVLLYWLHKRSSIKIFKYSSAIVLLLMTFSLLMDWSIANDKADTFIPVIFINWQGAITNIVTIFSLGLYAVLLRKTAATEEYVLGIKNSLFSNCLAVAALLLTLWPAGVPQCGSAEEAGLPLHHVVVLRGGGEEGVHELMARRDRVDVRRILVLGGYLGR